MSTPGHQILEAARIQSEMSFNALWVAYFALGGVSSPAVVRSYLDGAGPPVADYDVLAHALNERFVDRGGNHPVPYAEELV